MQVAAYRMDAHRLQSKRISTELSLKPTVPNPVNPGQRTFSKRNYLHSDRLTI